MRRLGSGLMSLADEAVPECMSVTATGAHVWCITQHGDHLFAGLADGSISVWEVAEPGSAPRRVSTLSGHAGVVYALYAQPGLLFSAGADGVLRTWRLGATDTSHTLLAESRPLSLPLLSLAGGGDDPAVVFSGGADGSVRRWRASRETGAIEMSHAAEGAHEKEAFGICALRARDGGGSRACCCVASVGGEGSVRLWGAEALEPMGAVYDGSGDAGGSGADALSLFCVAAVPAAPTEAASSPTAALLLGGSDGQLRLLELPPAPSAGRLRRPTSAEPLTAGGEAGSASGATGHTGFVVAIVAVSATTAFSASLDGTVAEWDLPRRCALRTFTAHGNGVYGMTCAGNGGADGSADGSADGPDACWTLLRTCSSDANMKEWRLPAQAERPDAAGGAVGAAAPRTAACAPPSALPPPAPPPVEASAPSPRSAWSSAEHRLHVFEPFAVAPPGECVWCTCCLADGSIATGGDGGEILVYDLLPAEAAPLHRASLYGHTDAVHSLCTLDEGRLLASASADGTARLWCTGTLRCVATLLGAAGVRVLACCGGDAPDLVTGDSAGALSLWAAAGAETARAGSRPLARTARVEAHEGEAFAVARCEALRMVVSAGADHLVRLWRLGGGGGGGRLEAAAPLDPDAHGAPVFALALLAAGSGAGSATPRARPALLASADARGEVVVWALGEMRAVPVSRLSGGDGSLCALASPVAGMLCAAGGRGEILIWDDLDADATPATGGATATGAPLRPASIQPKPPDACADASESGVLSMVAVPHAAGCGGHGRRRLLLGCADGSVICCEVAGRAAPAVSAAADGPGPKVLSGHRGCVWALAAHSDYLLSAGDDSTVRVWRAAAAADIGANSGGADAAGGEAETAREYSLSQVLTCERPGSPRQSAGGPSEAEAGVVYAVLLWPRRALDAGDTIVAGLGDGRVQLWVARADGGWESGGSCEVARGGVLCFAAPGGAGGDVAFCGSADGALASLRLAHGEGGEGGGEQRLVCASRVAQAHGGAVHAVANHADIVVSCSADGGVRVWSTSLELVHTLGAPAAAAPSGSPGGGDVGAHGGRAVYALLVVPELESSPEGAGEPARPRRPRPHGPRLFSGGADFLVKAWCHNRQQPADSHQPFSYTHW